MFRAAPANYWVGAQVQDELYDICQLLDKMTQRSLSVQDR